MAVGDTLPHCTGTGTDADPYIYTTAQGFLEAIAVAEAYVEAGQQNLVFDANDGVISRVIFYCQSVEGKGTTIRNLIALNWSSSDTGYLIHVKSTTSLSVSHLNFYNMCVINATTNYTVTGYIRDNGAERKTTTFLYCNFTGVFRGMALQNGEGLFKTLSYNDSFIRKCYYNNCTFNININSAAATSNNQPGLHIFQGASDYTEGYLNNCVVSISGIYKGSLSSSTDWKALSVVYSYRCVGCTFTNSGTTPIKITSNVSYIQYVFRSGSAYNYIKHYASPIAGATNVSMRFTNASNTLLNRSRITNYLLDSGAVISMQETDPTQTDYIYNETNLNDAGFLVGQVIE